MPSVPFDTLLPARDAIRAKKISSTELVRAALERIATLDPTIAAFNSIWAERALEQAKLSHAAKRPGVLAGVPIVVKDNMCAAVGLTTCSSRILENFRSPYDATVIKKL